MNLVAASVGRLVMSRVDDERKPCTCENATGTACHLSFKSIEFVVMSSFSCDEI